VKLMAQDLTYAIEEGRRLGVSLETGRAGLALFRAAAESGWGERDLSAVIEALRKG
jgi:3-hydroxyisobutyrate dehydrogenase-like beta-hydroxyacid dehydrogenase